MSKELPDVSVIIPCYNGERFVSEAMESVLGQTRANLELIVVDDGSSDGSVEIVERYLKDPRVKHIKHGSNRGISAARNTGIRNSAGRYLGFLDQDDLWRAGKLEAQLGLMENKESADVRVVFTDVEVVGLDRGAKKFLRRRVPARIETLEPDALISSLFFRDFICIGSALIDRECFDDIGLLNEEIRSGSDDFDLFVRLAHKYRFYFVDEPLVVRREHGGNYTDAEKMMPDALKILDRTLKERPALSRIEGRVRNRYLYYLARDLQIKGERPRAIDAYKKAVRARPLRIKSFLALLLCMAGKPGDAVLSLINRRTGPDPRH